jgi:hypothetical protein
MQIYLFLFIIPKKQYLFLCVLAFYHNFVKTNKNIRYGIGRKNYSGFA